ncbi:MAG: GGDEF domain-containing protein [Armatimonadota bacterium]
MTRLFQRWYLLGIFALLYGGGLFLVLLRTTSTVKQAQIGGGALCLAVVLTLLCLKLALTRLKLNIERLPWRFICLSALAFLLVSIYWQLPVLLGKRPPAALWGDLLFVALHLLLWVGIVMHEGQFPRLLFNWLELACGVLILLAATAIIGQYLPYHAVILSDHLSIAQRVVVWGYPAMVLGTLVCLLLLLNRAVAYSHLAPRAVLAFTLCLFVLGDLGLTQQLLSGHRKIPFISMALWVTAYLLFAMVAWWEIAQRNRESSETRQLDDTPAVLGPLLPLAFLICAAIHPVQLLYTAHSSVLVQRQAGMSLAVLLVLAIIRQLLAIAGHRQYALALRRRYREVERSAVTDLLTGLANQRYLRKRLEEEISRAKRYKRPLAVLFTDIDFFKMINDAYGHHAGDQVLRAVAATLHQAIRVTDVIARYGGEEFVILLPETTLANASILAERLRQKIEALEIPLSNGPRIHVTISLGTAALPETSDTLEGLLSDADEAMNRAKDTGRNRVVDATAKRTLYAY